MTWSDLLEQGSAESHRTSKEELDDLRSAIRRNMADASLAGLSTDNRFGLAYEAALLLARMAIACAGYRTKGVGAHRVAFLALELAIGPSASRAAGYFDRCRRKRNELSYEAAGVTSKNEAEEILREVRRFEKDVETWISSRYPSLRAEA